MALGAVHATCANHISSLILVHIIRSHFLNEQSDVLTVLRPELGDGGREGNNGSDHVRDTIEDKDCKEEPERITPCEEEAEGCDVQCSPTPE